MYSKKTGGSLSSAQHIDGTRMAGPNALKLADNRPQSAIQAKRMSGSSDVVGPVLGLKPVQLVKDGEESGFDYGAIRASADLVGSGVGLYQDVKKKKSRGEITGKGMKLAGSAAKLGGKVGLPDAYKEMAGGIGTNLKTTGEDISEAFRTLNDKKAAKGKKIATAGRAVVSVSGTLSETLESFGIIESKVPTGVITLISDSVKALTFGHDFYEILSKISTAYQGGTLAEEIWAQAAAFFQKLGNVSLSALRAVALWERLKGTEFESFYKKLMPLGKALTNLATSFGQAKVVYDNYKHYQNLTRMSKSGAKRVLKDNKGNLELLAHAKFDQVVKGLIETIVSIGETIYWAGKHFVMIKGVSVVVGAGSKILKTASTLFTSLGVRQTARDYIPFASLVDKSKTSGKLKDRRKYLVQFLMTTTNDKVLKAVGLDAKKGKDETMVRKLVESLV